MIGRAALLALVALAAGCGGSGRHARPTATPAASVAHHRRASPRTAIAGSRPGRRDVYFADRAGHLARWVRRDPARVYVPNSGSGTVEEISQRTGRIVARFATGALPQHVTPSWDLRTLWVSNDRGNSLTPIDPRTGRPGRPVPVTDPYNLYFTADGRRAIVVAEA